ncbi:MAG: zinc ABC transporter substrate-binding protein [Bdellovibrionales bacterium]|nr:zinc ABC transporter substrate-binding protein [Bdellovibrionales bacterium]
MKTQSTLKSLLALALLASVASGSAEAKLNVITTIPDLRSITEEVAGDLVNVESLGRGTQDPHYIEAKPSYMLKVNKADLVISIGMELEIGWLPSILAGARNPKVNAGEKGNLEVGSSVEPLEVPKGNISRADGDVHPAGNPHVTLDPIRAGEIAQKIAARLGELDPPNAAKYEAGAKALVSRLTEKSRDWDSRIRKSGVTQVITYHKTLTYFLDRFKLENPAILEPKPGIPPTSGHIIDVIKLAKEKKIGLVLVENYFDPTVTTKIKQEVPGLRAVTVAVAVDGAPGVKKIDDVYEGLVKAIEGSK